MGQTLSEPVVDKVRFVLVHYGRHLRVHVYGQQALGKADMPMFHKPPAALQIFIVRELS